MGIKNLVKTVVGVALISALLIVPAFAEVDQALYREVTLEEAKEMAVENSLKKRNRELTINQLESLREEAFIRTEGARYSVDNWIVDQMAKQALLNLVQTDIDLEMSKKMDEIEKIQIEHTVELLVLSIFEKEKHLELETSKLATQQKNFFIDRLRKQLGVISQVQLENTEETLNQAEIMVDNLRVSLDKDMSAMTNLLGQDDLKVIYDSSDFNNDSVVQLDIATHTRRVQSADPYIWIQEKRIEKAYKDLVLFTYSESGLSTPYSVRESTYNMEKNELAAIKNRYAESLQNKAYDIQQLENQMDLLKSQLESFMRQYQIAELQFELGMLTQQELEQLKNEESTLRFEMEKLQNQLFRMKTIFQKPFLAPDYLS